MAWWALALFASDGALEAVRFTGEQTAAGEWTYVLTYDPLDNYAICQEVATITLRGLYGVVEAFPPTSTDFDDDSLDRQNLAWYPEILDWGTAVRWSNPNGTGNFSEPRRVFGFRVVAPGAVHGQVEVVTDGFERDRPCPAPSLDLSATVGGPIVPPAVEARWQIRLKTRVTTPPAAVPSSLETRALRLLETRVSEGGADAVHLILQLTDDLSEARRRELAAEGVYLLQPLGGPTWIGAVDRRALARLGAIRELRWAEVLAGEDKVDPALRTVERLPYELRTGGRVACSVLFHDDVAWSEAAALVERLGGTFENVEEASFGWFRGGVVALPPAAIDELAAADAVIWIEPGPPPLAPDNRAAQRLAHVDELRGAPYQLSGRGVPVGVWEAFERPAAGALRAQVLAAHREFGGRARVAPGEGTAPSRHATMVAGTLAGDGSLDGAAQGMAPAATISSYDATNDVAEMIAAAASPGGTGNPLPAEVSNHSYGGVIGWNNPPNYFDNRRLFGAYTADSRAYDQVVTQSGLVVVKSAGNDRIDQWNGTNPVLWNGNTRVVLGPPTGQPIPPRDCRQGGLAVDADCIPPRGAAKNVITVGAVQTANQVAPFSSFGPTDDGRIKPDLVAPGVGLLSPASNDLNLDGVDDCVPANRCHFFPFLGTSASTPVVSGAVANLMQLANRRGLRLAPSSYKALLIQTARDVVGGQAGVGPDFASGWGLLDAAAAAELLNHPFAPAVIEDSLVSTGAGGALTYPVVVPPGQSELRVTLAWDDPPAAVNQAATLINDLDLRLVGPGNALFRPWLLNGNNPGLAAVPDGGTDTVNNVEQVAVRNPAPGRWTVRVSADAGHLPQGPQRFSVAGIKRLLPFGQLCGQHADCLPVYEDRGYCADGARCAPPDGTGQQGDYCHHDKHCDSGRGLTCRCSGPENGPWCHDWERGNRGFCDSGRSLGESCGVDADCAAIRERSYCANGARCAPPNGFGQDGDYCHHDDHCGENLTCVCLGSKNGPWCHDWERGNRGVCRP